jgi:hypothetical protein
MDGTVGPHETTVSRVEPHPTAATKEKRKNLMLNAVDNFCA